jgi:hypothetical protein
MNIIDIFKYAACETGKVLGASVVAGVIALGIMHTPLIENIGTGLVFGATILAIRLSNRFLKPQF